MLYILCSDLFSEFKLVVADNGCLKNHAIICFLSFWIVLIAIEEEEENDKKTKKKMEKKMKKKLLRQTPEYLALSWESHPAQDICSTILFVLHETLKKVK